MDQSQHSRDDNHSKLALLIEQTILTQSGGVYQRDQILFFQR